MKIKISAINKLFITDILSNILKLKTKFFFHKLHMWGKYGNSPIKEKSQVFDCSILSFSFCTQTRGRTGMDVTPLVFETSASTDSAIWAFFSNAMQR